MFHTKLMSSIEANGLTLDSFSDRLIAIGAGENTRKSLDKWISGDYRPTVDNFRRMCIILRITPNELLEWDDASQHLPEATARRPELSESERAQRRAANKENWRMLKEERRQKMRDRTKAKAKAYMENRLKKLREVIVKHSRSFGGTNLSDIAEAMECSEKTARAQISRLGGYRIKNSIVYQDDTADGDGNED